MFYTKYIIYSCMTSPSVDRFHTLSTAYQGFYASEEEELNKTNYTSLRGKAGTPEQPGNVKQDLIGEVAQLPVRLAKPPYMPVMHYETKRTPLGGPSLSSQDTRPTLNSRSRNQIVLSDIEFAILCGLAGIGIVMLLVPQRIRSDK